MIEEELIKIWQSSCNQERAKFDKSRLIIGIQSSIDDFNKKLRFRDSSEQAGAIFGIPVFGYYAYSSPFVLTKITSVLIIFWGIYVIVTLRKTKKHKPVASSETYLNYLSKTRNYIAIQKHLLESALYWYILPAMTLLLLFVLGPGVTGRWPQIIKIGVLDIGVAILFHFLHKRSVNKKFIPRLEKIDQLIKVLRKE